MIQQFNHYDPIISNVGTFYLLWQWPLYTLPSLAPQRYRPGDRVDVNCTSELSKPAADLVWDGILLTRFLSNERDGTKFKMNSLVYKRLPQVSPSEYSTTEKLRKVIRPLV